MTQLNLTIGESLTSIYKEILKWDLRMIMKICAVGLGSIIMAKVWDEYSISLYKILQIYKIQRRKDIPGPAPTFLIGNLLDFDSEVHRRKIF